MRATRFPKEPHLKVDNSFQGLIVRKSQEYVIISFDEVFRASDGKVGFGITMWLNGMQVPLIDQRWLPQNNNNNNNNLETRVVLSALIVPRACDFAKFLLLTDSMTGYQWILRLVH